MNILIISQHYGLINGGSICTCELIAKWSSMVERIDVVCSQKWYRPEGLSQAKNVFVHPVSNFTPLQVRAKCKSLVTDSTVLYGADDYGIFGKMKKVPYVLTYHGNWPQALRVSPAYFIKGIFHIFLYILNFYFADLVISINYFYIPWISQFNSKVKMIRNGINLKSSNIQLSLSHPCLITVGRMDERKGKLLVDIIKTLSNLAEKLPWHLYILGSIAYEPLNSLVDNQRVFSIGFVPNVADYVKEAEVFLLASSMENLSLAVTEAMALSKPVVCFDVGALGEVVSEETGALIPRFDVQKFAQATLELLHDQEKRKLKGEKAKEVVKDFDWNKSALQYLELFQELLDRKISF